MSFSLSSTMESVSEIEAVAEKMAAEAGLDEDERFHLTMAVREAAVNAVLHGNDYDPSKMVTASFENTGASLVFTIADQGKGLDPDTIPDPLAPENLLRGTGRGIFLIRSSTASRNRADAHQASGAGWQYNLGHLRRARRSRPRESIPADDSDLVELPSLSLLKCYNGITNKEEFPWHLLLLPVKWTA
jgi:serine/threonine-protein kinase RsbW